LKTLYRDIDGLYRGIEKIRPAIMANAQAKQRRARQMQKMRLVTNMLLKYMKKCSRAAVIPTVGMRMNAEDRA
jgi:hypothetical protein